MRILGTVALICSLGLGCLHLQPSPYQDLGPLLAALATGGTGNKFLAFGNGGVGLESAGDGRWTKFTGSPALSLTKVVFVNIGGVKTLFGTDGTTNNTLHKSTNLGRTWTQVPLTLSVSTAITRLTACGQKILAAHANGLAVDGAFSADGGTSWSGTLTLIPAGASGNIAGIGCDPGTQRFYAMRTNLQPSQRYSDNPAVAWSNPTTNGAIFANGTYPFIAANNGVILYVGTSTGPEIWGAPDGGVNYNGSAYLTFGFPTSVTLSHANKSFRVGTVLGGVCTFHRSAAGTAGWSNVPLNSCAATALSDIQGNGTDILVAAGTATASPFLARSKDDGATWAAEDLSSLTGVAGLSALVYVP